MATVIVLILQLIGGGALRGAGDSQTPMRVTALANVINVGLSYALIFGSFGLPAMGAVGSAWATFIARLIGVIVLLVFMWRGRKGVSIRGKGSWLPQWSVARSVFAIGVPAAMEQVLITAGFFVLTILVAGLGTLTLAAHRIAFNALSLSFLPGIGFAIAATALVGQSYGAQRFEEGREVARIATLWAMLWMGSMAAVIFFFAPQVMRLYSSDPQVIRIGAAGLRVVALAQPFWAIFFVQAGALRGLGNTRFPLWVNTFGIWIAVGLAYLFIQTVGGGLAAVWAAFLITAPVTAAILWWRFGRAIAALTPAPEPVLQSG